MSYPQKNKPWIVEITENELTKLRQEYVRYHNLGDIERANEIAERGKKFRIALDIMNEVLKDKYPDMEAQVREIFGIDMDKV